MPIEFNQVEIDKLFEQLELVTPVQRSEKLFASLTFMQVAEVSGVVHTQMTGCEIEPA